VLQRNVNYISFSFGCKIPANVSSVKEVGVDQLKVFNVYIIFDLHRCEILQVMFHKIQKRAYAGVSL